jgi:predicted  nucleic acid-binding Zn-ribbon protein
VEAEKAKVRERTASDQKQLTELAAERKNIVATLSPELLKDYERIRK